MELVHKKFQNPTEEILNSLDSMINDLNKIIKNQDNESKN